MGISKRELLNDFYPDELDAIFEEYAIINGAEKIEEEQATPTAFLQM